MPGTHLCGRVDHNVVGGQQGADLQQVEMLKKRFTTVPVILDSGAYRDIYVCFEQHIFCL